MIAVEDLVPLARGGTAELFTARAGMARVVVKLPRGDRADAAAALAAEAAILERLSGIASPRLLGRTHVRQRDALVLEHVPTPNLRAAVTANQELAVAAAVCAAVARVHAAGIVHGDLSPDNLLLQQVPHDDRAASEADRALPAVHVIDFGAAAPVGDVLGPLATIGYAAPERLTAGCRATPAVDVYALGVICFELMTGAAPFTGTAGELRVAHAGHRVPRISEHAGVPAAVDDLVARAMAKRPERRPSAAALADALAAAADRPPVDQRSGRDACVTDACVTNACVADACVTDAPRARAGRPVRRRATASIGLPAHCDPYSMSDVRTASPREAHQLRPSSTTRAVSPARDARPGSPVPLVARGQPLAEIETAARSVRAGGSALITVWGGPGLGKSRLSEAVAADLRTCGLVTMVARAPTIAMMIDRVVDRADERVSDRAPAPADDRADERVDDRADERVADRVSELVADRVSERVAGQLDRPCGVGTLDADRAALEVMAGRRGIAGTAAEPMAPAPGALRQAAARALARMLAPGGQARAIVVDDAHAADPIVLDALELATLAPGGVLVVALARPQLAATRPRWSRRAVAARSLTLAPLDREAGRELVRALLPAGAAVPGAAIDRLVDRAGGVPLHVIELVAAVLRADRARGGTGAATRGALPTDLVELSPDTSVIAWAVGDQLAGLPAGAALAAEVLALATRPIRRAEVVALFDALDAAGVRSALDPDVAIADLVAAGVLVELPADAGLLGFRHDLIRDAIAQRVDAARRAAIHRTLGGLASGPGERAHHAEGAGDRAGAALAWLDAARTALARHDDLAVETALGRALACGAPPSAAVLRQRGSARARLGRHDAAAADFAAARALAWAAGDRGAAIDALLDEATALDWALHHRAAAACADQAAALAGRDEPALRRARLAMAAARTAWRAGDAARAIAPCREAIALADPLGADGYETRIACRLMLGFIVGGLGDIAEASALLDRALTEATARGDLQHAAAARCNRYPVHAARGDAAALRADFAAFTAAGRELGVAVTEYRGELYQALLALWCGDDATALVHARAAHRLEAADPELFPRPRAALVIAELAARRRDAATVAAVLAAIAAAPPSALAAIDAIMRDGLSAWLAGRLELAVATELADAAIAAGEPEAAFQLLELAACAAAQRGDLAAAALAQRVARSRPPSLPRFLPAPIGAA